MSIKFFPSLFSIHSFHIMYTELIIYFFQKIILPRKWCYPEIIWWYLIYFCGFRSLSDDYDMPFSAFSLFYRLLHCFFIWSPQKLTNLYTLHLSICNMSAIRRNWLKAWESTLECLLQGFEFIGYPIRITQIHTQAYTRTRLHIRIYNFTCLDFWNRLPSKDIYHNHKKLKRFINMTDLVLFCFSM